MIAIFGADALAGCASHQPSPTVGGMGASPAGLRADGAHESTATVGHVTVLADASLYHRAALLDALWAAGERVAPDAPAAALVAHAWLAWGEEGLARLEGDYAIVLWDARVRALAGCRDFAGTRPLFWAPLPRGGCAMASSIVALLALDGVDAALDVGVLGESASWVFLPHDRTVRRGVRRVEPGALVTQADGRAPRVRRLYEPPVFERAAGASSFEAGAEELRALLRDAVRERLSPAGATAVWMSGGYDSTAVYAAGRDAGTGNALFPVSVSYPRGDTGREDEAIELVAARWQAPVRWLRSADVDLFGTLGASMAASEEPFDHLYAAFNAALARTTVAAGARVALGGYGGDQLFWASPVYHADLLRRGSLRTLAGEARRNRLGWRGLLRWMMRPLLPAWSFPLARRLGAGHDWRPPLDRAVPAWMAPAFVEARGVEGALRRAMPRRSGESLSAYDTYYSIANPFFARVLQAVTRIARAEGVEYRSPLFDRRIVAFAATRPRRERASGGQQKLLLRHAMRPLLPASVLAPRPYKTGTARDLFTRSARQWLPAMLADVARAPRLGDHGIVDVDAFRRACADFTERGNVDAAAELMPALQVELWLRAQEAHSTAATSPTRARGPVRIRRPLEATHA